jgi:hypothetical protein
MDYLDTPV